MVLEHSNLNYKELCKRINPYPGSTIDRWRKERQRRIERVKENWKNKALTDAVVKIFREKEISPGLRLILRTLETEIIRKSIIKFAHV